MVVPSALVHYTFDTFGSAAAVTDSRVFDQIWEYVERFVRWVLNLKASIRDQVSGILENLDEHYQEFRERLKKIEKEFEGDQLFEVILLIPDTIVYFARLICDDNVSREFKIEMGLALVYLVSPLDFIPEGLIQHPIAFADDAGIALMVLKHGFDGKYITQEQLETHWPGDTQLLRDLDATYQSIMSVLGDTFFMNLWNYLRRKVAV